MAHKPLRLLNKSQDSFVNYVRFVSNWILFIRHDTIRSSGKFSSFYFLLHWLCVCFFCDESGSYQNNWTLTPISFSLYTPSSKKWNILCVCSKTHIHRKRENHSPTHDNSINSLSIVRSSTERVSEWEKEKIGEKQINKIKKK